MNPQSRHGIASDDATTMASQLESQNSKYVNSKFSYYEEKNGGGASNTP